MATPPQKSPLKEVSSSCDKGGQELQIQDQCRRFHSVNSTLSMELEQYVAWEKLSTSSQPTAKSLALCCSPWHCLDLFRGRRKLEDKIKQQHDMIKSAFKQRDEASKKLHSLKLEQELAVENLKQQHEIAVQQLLADKDAALQEKEEAERQKEEAEQVKREIEEHHEQEKTALEQTKVALAQKQTALMQADLERSAAIENVRHLKKEMEDNKRRTPCCDAWSYMLRLLCCCKCCMPRAHLGDCFGHSGCYREQPSNSSSSSQQVEIDDMDHPFAGDPHSSMELINALIASEWPFISMWFHQQMVATALPCLQELFRQYGVDVSIGDRCDLGTKPMQLLNIATKNYKEFLSDDTEIDNLQILGRLDYHSDAQMILNLQYKAPGDLPIAHTQVAVSDIIIKGELVIELVKLTHAPPWFSGVRIFSPNVPDVDLKVNATLLGMNLSNSWLKSTIIDAITRNVITPFAVLPNRFTINLGDRIDAFSLKHPAPQGVLRLAVMKANGLTSSQEGAWSFRPWSSSNREAPAENADPQAVVTLGAKTIETSKREKTLNPDWGEDEIHDLVVTDKEKQKLRIVLRDAQYGPRSNKPSEFGRVDVPVKTLTNCVDNEKIIQLAGADSAGAGSHGQLVLKAQFRELANTAPDTQCSPELSRFVNFEWDFGVRDKTGVLLMADVFYASGLPPCEDGTPHWVEIKVSGYRSAKVPADECPPIEVKTQEVPGRSAVQHGRDLVSSLGPDIRDVLSSDAEEDLARNVWRKRVEIREEAQQLETLGSQLVDVVFDAPFSFKLDSVAQDRVTVELAVFRHEKARRGASRKCVGRIEQKLYDKSLSDSPIRNSYLLGDSSSVSTSSSGHAEDQVGQLRWRLQARPLLKQSEPTLKEATERRSSHWLGLSGSCFSGMRKEQEMPGPVSFAPEVIPSSQEEEQKVEEPVVESVVEQPAAGTSWWPSLFFGKSASNAVSEPTSASVPSSEPVENAVIEGETSHEDSVVPLQDMASPSSANPSYFSWLLGRSAPASASSTAAVIEVQSEEDSSLQPPPIEGIEPAPECECSENSAALPIQSEEVSASANDGSSNQSSWLWRLWTRKSVSATAEDSNQQKVLEEDETLAKLCADMAEVSVEEPPPLEPDIESYIRDDTDRHKGPLRRAISDSDIRRMQTDGRVDEAAETADFEETGYQSDQDGKRKNSPPEPRRFFNFLLGSRQKLEEPEAQAEQSSADAVVESTKEPQAVQRDVRLARVNSFESVVECSLQRQNSKGLAKATQRSASATSSFRRGSSTSGSGNSLTDPPFPRFSGPSPAAVDVQVPKLASPEVGEVKDDDTEPVHSACSLDDVGAQQASQGIVDHTSTNAVLSPENGEGTPTPFWANVRRILSRRGPASSTSPSARLRTESPTDNDRIPQSKSAPTLEEVIPLDTMVTQTLKVGSKGQHVSDEGSVQHHSTVGAPSTNQVVEDADDLDSADPCGTPPFFQGGC